MAWHVLRGIIHAPLQASIEVDLLMTEFIMRYGARLDLACVALARRRWRVG